MTTKLSIADRPIRFALVGCGRISKSHFESLKLHQSRAELVAVCDVREAALQAAVATTGVPELASLEALRRALGP